MDNEETAGMFIEWQMRGKGWTQKHLASATGISQQVISLMIRDKMLVSIKQAALLGLGLGGDVGRRALIIQSEQRLRKDLQQLDDLEKELYS